MCRANCTEGEQGILHTFREEMSVQKAFWKCHWVMLVFHRLKLVEFCCLSLLFHPDMLRWWHSGMYTMKTSLAAHVQLYSAHTHRCFCLYFLSCQHWQCIFLRVFLAVPLRCSAAKWWVEPTQQELVKSSLFVTDFLVTLSLWGRSHRGQLNHWGNVSALACLFCCFVAQHGRLGNNIWCAVGSHLSPSIAVRLLRLTEVKRLSTRSSNNSVPQFKFSPSICLTLDFLFRPGDSPEINWWVTQCWLD